MGVQPTDREIEQQSHRAMHYGRLDNRQITAHDKIGATCNMFRSPHGNHIKISRKDLGLRKMHSTKNQIYIELVVCRLQNH